MKIIKYNPPLSFDAISDLMDEDGKRTLRVNKYQLGIALELYHQLAPVFRIDIELDTTLNDNEWKLEVTTTSKETHFSKGDSSA